MTTPEIADTRLHIKQIEQAVAWSRPIPGDRPMSEFLAQFHRYMLAKRDLRSLRRRLKRLEHQ